MIELTVLAFVGYAGWKRMPWWTAAVGTLVSLAITIFKMTRISGIRSQSGLPPFEVPDYAGSMLTILVLNIGVYVLGRWIASRRANTNT